MKILNEVDFTMPTITGSDKQIAWAQDIIQSAINYIESNAKIDADLADKMIAQFPDSPAYAEYKRDHEANCMGYKRNHEAKWLELARSYAVAISGKEFAARTVIDNQDRFNWKCIEATERYNENKKWQEQMKEYNNEH